MATAATLRCIACLDALTASKLYINVDDNITPKYCVLKKYIARAIKPDQGQIKPDSGLSYVNARTPIFLPIKTPYHHISSIKHAGHGGRYRTLIRSDFNEIANLSTLTLSAAWGEIWDKHGNCQTLGVQSVDKGGSQCAGI